jgi:hypothetical protein
MPVQQVSGELLAESPIAVAEVMMNRALAALEANPRSAPIIDAYVVIGELSFDDCCGILAAAPARVFKSGAFPQQAIDVTDADLSLLAVDIAVILLRCAPSIDANGIMPSSTEMSEAFTAASHDAAVIYDAMLADMPSGWERANLEQTFQGAEGGCIAIDTRMTVGLPQTDWCVNVEPA